MNHFEAIVIGTGFGGAVTACRLAQAGIQICILERGRRYEKGDFPRSEFGEATLPGTSRWFWSTDRGLWDVRDLKGIHVVQAAGYGGGSLVYANVHLRVPPEVFGSNERDPKKSSPWPQSGHPYTRQALDPYYDIVAAMLEVQPLPQKYFSPPLKKRERMEQMAQELGRTASFFHPPLAIHFGPPDLPHINPFGREQQGCNGCGDCTIGCQIQAKNTLNLSYLAFAEDQPTTEVRTLAEVQTIEERGSEEGPLYHVHYRDHLQGAEIRTVIGQRVFLCAGSVNSTEILLRSRQAGHLKTPPGQPEDLLGSRYFTNGDALAMVYDTDEEHEPTRGPTITTSLLYNGREDGHWFLLQEGGYPKSLAPLFGLFRGGLWMGQNRRRFRKLKRKLPTSREPSDTNPLGLAAKITSKVIPYQWRSLLDSFQKQINERESPILTEVSEEVWEEIRRRWVERKPRYLRWFFKCLAGLANRQIIPFLFRATRDILHKRYTSWVPLAATAVRRLLQAADPGDNSALLLVMGRDEIGGHLHLDTSEKLCLEREAQPRLPLHTTQERLMSDVAEVFGGELRLNPNETLWKKGVVAHSLGGCPMADSPDQGITNPYGEVYGSPSLFVMDGAIIPTALGINPSSTIAAIAERNIRHHIGKIWGKKLSLSHLGPEGHTFSPNGQRKQWSSVLDPLGQVSAESSPPPRTPPVGLKFTEQLEGFYNDSWENPSHYSSLQKGLDRIGRTQKMTLRAELQATIPDLNLFFEDPSHEILLDGRVWIQQASGQEPVESRTKGRLCLLTEERKCSNDCQIVYQLRLADGPYERLEGYKVAQNHLQNHAWSDMTSISFQLFRRKYPMAHPPSPSSGVLRLHMGDFFMKGLPSFEVTGTDDPVRIAWEISRFTGFFLGTLQKVYLPQIDRVLNPWRAKT